VGVLIALVLISLLALGYRTIFLISAIPAVAAVLLIFFIDESERTTDKVCKPDVPILGSISKFPKELKVFVAAMAILSVTSVMTSFLIVLASDSGASLTMTVAFYLAFNVVYAGLSIPAGSVSDKSGRYPVILAGYAALFAMFVVAIFCANIWMALVAFLLYGLSYALTQGVQKALVADLSPPEMKGSALGMYNMAIGIAALPMALVGGFLWDAYGAWATFSFGAAVSSIGLAMLVWLAFATNGRASRVA